MTPPSPKPPVQQRIPIAAIAVPLLIMGGLIAIVVVQSRLSEESVKELDRRSIERLGKQLDAKFGKLEDQHVYVLVDAERRAAAHPTTIEIPSRARRTSCKVGDLVKVILETPPGAPARQATGERPWLIIEKVIPGPQPLYVGRLDNDLVVFTEVKGSERIVFGPEHIIELCMRPKMTISVSPLEDGLVFITEIELDDTPAVLQEQCARMDGGPLLPPKLGYESFSNEAIHGTPHSRC